MLSTVENENTVLIDNGEEVRRDGTAVHVCSIVNTHLYSVDIHVCVYRGFQVSCQNEKCQVQSPLNFC